MPAKLKGKVGPTSLVSLARELRAGGDAASVVEQDIDGTAALVWVGEADEAVLRAARRAQRPIVALSDVAALPHVSPEDTRSRTNCSTSFRSAAWALKGAIAYGGTRVIGEGAVRSFDARR